MREKEGGGANASAPAADFASSHYVEVVTSTRRYLHRQTLSSLVAQLDPDTFVRTHRGAIAAVARIRRIEARREGLTLSLEGDVTIPVSASYRHEVEHRITQYCIRGRQGG